MIFNKKYQLFYDYFFVSGHLFFTNFVQLNIGVINLALSSDAAILLVVVS